MTKKREELIDGRSVGVRQQEQHVPTQLQAALIIRNVCTTRTRRT